MGFGVGRDPGETYHRLVATFQLKEFFANFRCDQVERRAPIAHPTSHTQWLSVAHPEEAEEAALAEEEVDSLPVEVSRRVKLS